MVLLLYIFSNNNLKKFNCPKILRQVWKVFLKQVLVFSKTKLLLGTKFQKTIFVFLKKKNIWLS